MSFKIRFKSWLVCLAAALSLMAAPLSMSHAGTTADVSPTSPGHSMHSHEMHNSGVMAKMEFAADKSGHHDSGSHHQHDMDDCCPAICDGGLAVDLFSGDCQHLLVQKVTSNKLSHPDGQAAPPFRPPSI